MINLRNFATVNKDWASFKATVAQKNLVIQHEENDEVYFVYAVEVETLIAYICTLWKGEVPNSTEYLQDLNDAYASEFVSDYKASSNKPTQISMRLGYTPSDLGQLVRKTVTDTSGSDDLLASGTPENPHVFKFDADPDANIAINEIRLVLAAQSVIIDGTKFGATQSLENGVQILVTSGGTDIEISNLRRTEDFLLFSSLQGLWTEYGGQRDLIMASMFVDGSAILTAGSSDCIKVLVRDELTHASFKSFSCLVVGRKLS